jgi:hypothetical protein
VICSYQTLFRNEMSGACDICRREERGVQGFIGRTLAKETTLKNRRTRRWEDILNVSSRSRTRGHGLYFCD